MLILCSLMVNDWALGSKVYSFSSSRPIIWAVVVWTKFGRCEQYTIDKMMQCPNKQSQPAF